MNKIMFNDRFNLTKLVLEGKKTQTRRIEIDCNIRFYLYNYEGSYPKIEDNKICIYSDDGYLLAYKKTRYKIGEEVAIAQSYKELGYDADALDRSPKDWRVIRGTLGNLKDGTIRCLSLRKPANTISVLLISKLRDYRIYPTRTV